MSENFPVGLAVFQVKVYKLVEDPSTDPFMSWGKDNNSFVIWNLEELIRSKILLKFNCYKFSAFLSDLKCYGFERIKNGSGEMEFGNEDFVRGQPERLKTMMVKAWRKRTAKARAREAAADKAAKRLKRLQI